MPVSAGNSGKILYTLEDPEGTYSLDDVIGILQKAEAAGLDIASDTRKLTLCQLDALVNGKGRYDA